MWNQSGCQPPALNCRLRLPSRVLSHLSFSPSLVSVLLAWPLGFCSSAQIWASVHKSAARFRMRRTVLQDVGSVGHCRPDENHYLWASSSVTLPLAGVTRQAYSGLYRNH